MPVTAKLSRRFSEAFGDEIANELVDWFNAVDLTYRGDLRALNELNFARFDAKLEQRIAQLEQRLAQLEARGAADLAATRADLIKWSFVFWIGTVVTIFLARLV